MEKLLLTGFTPFDGRTHNASWIAASEAIAHRRDKPRDVELFTLQIPVVWGAPGDLLPKTLERIRPTTVISMGEGREGWFDIETCARNERKHRVDNEGAFPPGPIKPDGPVAYQASINAKDLHRVLLDQAIPIRVSDDAGQFLCEETLYCLESQRETFGLSRVLFVHLPPYGTKVQYRGEMITCNETLLSDFVWRLIRAVLNLPVSATSEGKNAGAVASCDQKNLANPSHR